jgi:hypothetical protein
MRDANERSAAVVCVRACVREFSVKVVVVVVVKVVVMEEEVVVVVVVMVVVVVVVKTAVRSERASQSGIRQVKVVASACSSK